MKISKELLNKFENEIKVLAGKTNLSVLKEKMLQSGNSETRFAFDVMYMCQLHAKFRKEIDLENLNDDHLGTALKKILKNY